MKISSERISDEYLCVNSCAKQILSESDQTMIRKNGRVDWHILFITKGFCTIYVNDIETKVGAGNIILFKPHEPQKYSFVKKDNSVSRYIHFCGKNCVDILNKAKINSRVTYVGESGTLERLHQRLCEEFSMKKPMFEEICASLLSQFIMTAGRLSYYNKLNINIKNIKKISEICMIMHEEIDSNRSISEYAKLCNLSVDRFSHAFKESMGISPKQYLTNMKINTAIELLLNSDMSIAQIASAVGYDDSNYFSRLMKKYTGHSPKYYAKS